MCGNYSYPKTNLKQNISFPVGIPNLWFNAGAQLSPCPRLNDWLLNTGSLTERLQSQCRQFSVQLLGQSLLPIDPEESRYISDSAQSLMVREVILSGESRPWVFARTLMPAAFEDEGMRQLENLGSKPLGQVIFNDSRFQRQPFEIIKLPVANPIVEALGLVANFTLWGRRSVFHYKQHKLMVAEIFLPDAPAYAGFYTGSNLA